MPTVRSSQIIYPFASEESAVAGIVRANYWSVHTGIDLDR